MQRPRLREASEDFISGCIADIQEDQHLAEFVSELRWGFSAERKVEAGHVMVHVSTSSSRNRNESYDSLAWRFRDARMAVGENLPTFCDCLAMGRSPKRALE